MDDCGVMTLSYAKYLLCDGDLFKVKLSVTHLSLHFATIQTHSGGYRQMISEELSAKKLLLMKHGMIIFICAEVTYDNPRCDKQ